VLIALLLPAGGAAQKAVLPNTTPARNPVSTAIKERLEDQTKNFVAGAEYMPAARYSFKPTPEMMTFGALMFHVADTNYGLCASIGGGAAPAVSVTEKDPKDKLAPNLARSFEFCRAALARVDDSKLGDAVPFFDEKLISRADALITLSDDWNDHYAAQAIYLRLNGILPPTARPQLKKLSNSNSH
jgi:hypothetical protein